MDASPPFFLDVPTLLEASRPRSRLPLMPIGAAIFIAIVFISWYVSGQVPEGQEIISTISLVAMVGLIAAMIAITYFTVRAHRAEQQHLAAAEELVQLRRWPQAATLLQGLLARPMRAEQMRVQALIFLTAVLARFNRFSDAIAIENYLLDEIPLASSTAHALRLGRAMAMLREDRLFDADRAIAELRRNPEAPESSGLALLEIYRDVKTGHAAEAVELFQQKLPLMRQQLGHRVADGWILIAKAYDLLGRETEAKTAYENATVLCPEVELHRRYPDVVSLASKYQAAKAPAEVQ